MKKKFFTFFKDIFAKTRKQSSKLQILSGILKAPDKLSLYLNFSSIGSVQISPFNELQLKFFSRILLNVTLFFSSNSKLKFFSLIYSKLKFFSLLNFNT